MDWPQVTYSLFIKLAAAFIHCMRCCLHNITKEIAIQFLRFVATIIDSVSCIIQSPILLVYNTKLLYISTHYVKVLVQYPR